MRLSLSALLVLLAASGCDSSSDGGALDDGYYVGDWTVVGVSDGGGDRTALLNAALDELALSFRADRSFQLDADVSDLAAESGAEDFVASGTYQARPDVPALVLTSRGISATLGASAPDATGGDRVRLTAPAAAVNVLLGGLPFPLQGDVSVVIERS